MILRLLQKAKVFAMTGNRGQGVRNDEKQRLKVFETTDEGLFQNASLRGAQRRGNLKPVSFRRRRVMVCVRSDGRRDCSENTPP
jgi:hypothetical protein